jgi:hypothetical protein
MPFKTAYLKFFAPYPPWAFLRKAQLSITDKI